MTGRPHLPINTAGEIRINKVGDKWVAIANHRDSDGRVRQYQRSGPSKTAAKAALVRFLNDPHRTRGEINSNTRMVTLAEKYFKTLHEEVARGVLSPGTVRLYEGHWRNYGVPRLGQLTLAETDVQVIDRFLLDLQRDRSVAITRSMRAVLSGMLGLAARYKAIPTNPVRDVSRIRSGPTNLVRALEPHEVPDLLQRLIAFSKMPGKHVWTTNRQYTPTRIHPDIPDLVMWMLGTSQRIGQALAVDWPSIDLNAATAKLGPNVIRVKGEGLRINRGTSKTKEQVLGLPSQVVVMLLNRQRRPNYDPKGFVFPGDPNGGLRDPHNTLGDLRCALDMAGYEWVTSHTFRRTVATIMDDAGLSAREVADQLTHARPSMTQDRYMARKARNPRAVAAIEAMLATEPERRVIALDKERDRG